MSGTVTIGVASPSSLTNAGTVGVAPGGLIDLEKSSTLTNASNGLIAFGIDGPPTSPSDYGRITNGALSLDGSAEPVFENGFTPSPGAEYVVADGSFSGTFATVRNGATADYSHPGALGLVGGAPASATAVAITSAVPTSVFGQDVPFTATVTSAPGSDPTGSVSFSAGGVLLGSAPAVTAVGVTTATFDTASLPVGSEPVSATYHGDVLFGPSTSPVAAQVVNRDTANVTIEAAPADAVPGQQVTYTVVVSAAAPGAGSPAGTASLSDDGSPVAGCQSLTLSPAAPPQATCSETYDADATHSVVATYSGNADFSSSTAAATETVAPLPTTTTVTVSSRTSTTGGAVSFTATVAASTGTASPTGSVTFTDDGAPLGTSTLTTSGGVTTTSMLLTTLPLGVNPITASYGGDADFAASASGSRAGDGEPGPDRPGPGQLGRPLDLGTAGHHHGERLPRHRIRRDRRRHLLVQRHGHREQQRVERPGDPHHRHAACRDRLGHRHLRGRQRLHRQCHHGRLVPGGRSRDGLSTRETEIKQGNPCYIHPEERTRRSEGWAAMSVAIVTGASRGLGEALAAGLARAGWSLVVDGRDRTTLDAAADLARAQAAPDAHVVAVPGDITDLEHRHDLVSAAFDLGGLDLVVNNAGTLGASPLPSLADYPLGDLRVAFEVNVVAPLGLVQDALPLLLDAPHPRVLNVTSDAAVEAYEGWGGYGAGKAALEHLGAVLAVEFPDAEGVVGRPGRPAHRDAPGRVPGRGHLGPARAGHRGARLPRADPERPPERALPGRRPRVCGSAA